MLPPLSTEQVIERTVREEWGRILASLASGLNDLQLAEDCLQEAVISAMDHWGRNGLPRSPSAWLIIVARRKALDKLRRAQNFARKENEIAYLLELENRPFDDPMTETIPDKRLEMIFTCCHPALERKSQVALTLRTLGGLSRMRLLRRFWTNRPQCKSGSHGPSNRLRAVGSLMKFPKMRTCQNAYRWF